MKSDARLRKAIERVEQRRPVPRIARRLGHGRTRRHPPALNDMFILAEANRAGLAREESRGSHYRTDFPERNDERFLKTSVAKFENGKVSIAFEDLPTPLVKPRKRTYGKVEGEGAKKPATSNDPAKAREPAGAGANPS